MILWFRVQVHQASSNHVAKGIHALRKDMYHPFS